MPNSKEFLVAADTVKRLKTMPDNNELIELYGLYKQATVGNINTEKPMFLNLKEVTKWNAWNKHIGLSQYDSEVKYIMFVNDMIKKYSLN